MQLDKTDIVIRERGWGEMLDLALPLMRRHGPALLRALIAGALPAALLNHFLLAGILESADLSEGPPREFILCQLILTAVEIPIATSFMTLYLGKAMFLQRPRPRQLFREFLGSLPQLIWFQVIVRGALAVTWIGWLAPCCRWPYLNEVILLERHHGWPSNGKDKSTFRRSSEMHSGFSGEFFAICLGSLALGAAMIASLCLSALYLRTLISGGSQSDWWAFAVVLPSVEWLTVGYFAVVRYLSYLNLRIRNEGWELEIKLRAERARLIEQVA
jgi:hypothetical protein